MASNSPPAELKPVLLMSGDTTEISSLTGEDELSSKSPLPQTTSGGLSFELEAPVPLNFQEHSGNIFFPSELHALHTDQAPIFVFADQDDDNSDEDPYVRWEFEQKFEPKPGAIDADASLRVVHVFSMKSQGNLYTFADVARGVAGGRRILAACLSRPVYAMELVMVDNGDLTAPHVKPKKQEIKFTYVPAGADILSIDAFSRCNAIDDYIIGITFAKLQPNESGIPVPSGQYLNVYSEWQSPSDLDSLSESCLTIELDFIPYLLTHCHVPGRETAFLLSGSDERIHLYLEDRQAFMFVEVDIREFFPELSAIHPSVPISIEIHYLNGDYSQRITAIGCECGTVLLALVDCSSNRPPNVINNWRDSLGEGIACSIKAFTSYTAKRNVSVPTALGGAAANEDVEYDGDDEEVNLLVAFSYSHARVFLDVARKGLSDYQLLEKSNCFDTVNCALADDVDLDGQTELLLGTFGQELLCYKQDEERKWKLIWTRSFSHPILGLKSLDLTGDGVRELAVMTNKGIHVMQHDTNMLRKMRVERLRAFLRQQ